MKHITNIHAKLIAKLIIVVGACLLLTVGCGQPGNRLGLNGTVTLDGEPLEVGSIAFLPGSDTKGPTAGGRISEGQFSVAADKGIFEGEFRVAITASRKTGRQEKDPFGNPFDVREQYLPARYNRQSELTAEVTSSGPNEFEFALVSQ